MPFLSAYVLSVTKQLPKDDICVSATGYGRESIDFADYIFTEITCHAFGALGLCPDIQGVIDIGGQDSKVIQIQNNRINNFLMNDKCAAGTGRFLSMACNTLGILLEVITHQYSLFAGAIRLLLNPGRIVATLRK